MALLTTFRSACDLAHRLPGLAGITLADAFEIEAVVGHALSAKPRPPFKRISSLMPLFFELHEILCPPSGESSRLIATPQESKDAYERVRETRRQSASAVF